MRIEDFTALVDALLPAGDGTAAFLYAKQATLIELGARQLLFFLAETTLLRSRLADEANAAVLVELLGKCGLAAEDDLRLVCPPTFRSLGASQLEDFEHEPSGTTLRSLRALEHEGATEDNLVEVNHPPVDDEEALRQQAVALQAGLLHLIQLRSRPLRAVASFFEILLGLRMRRLLLVVFLKQIHQRLNRSSSQ